MLTIGLIGGMSWESSLEYYRIINESVKERLGGLHSAKCIMHSVDFAELEELMRGGDWGRITSILGDAAEMLERGGADCVLICTNTMHKIADEVQKSVSIPLIHIGDATGNEIVAVGLKKVGLLGTKFTMEEVFYKERLRKKFELEVIIPSEIERETIHGVIFNELCLGKVSAGSKEAFLKIISNLEKNGAQGIILGCTEIPLLVKDGDTKVPLFDSTKIHAKAAVDFALGKEGITGAQNFINFVRNGNFVSEIREQRSQRIGSSKPAGFGETAFETSNAGNSIEISNTTKRLVEPKPTISYKRILEKAGRK